MKAILTDVTKCIGCASCVTACKELNNLPEDLPRDWHKTDGLSSANWTSVIIKNETYIRKQCRHCIEPACESVCPVGALYKTESGAVVYDKSKCIGCRYCMMACPYGIPRYDWDSPTPYIRKCIMCHDNIKSGKIDQPACTKICPTQSTIYGERDELLKEAKRRIKSDPKYLDHIYGETEVGGTCVLYITSKDNPLDFLTYYTNRAGNPEQKYGYPDITESIPETTKTAMHSVPPAFLGMGTIMTGAYWIIKRRMKLEAEKNKTNNIVDVTNNSEVDNEQNK
ncbi:MAG: 4Fe-4S dicluster domain-containing protein [Chlorobi bacterium]|nr:4Fe-4S dicluster domain-containing protein [Chlorobiota bacterium]